MNKLLLVDFDGTIFNSDKFHKDIWNFLVTTKGFKLTDLLESYEKAKEDKKPHSLQKQFKILGIEDPYPLIEEITAHLIELGDTYLYSDSIEFIEQNLDRIIIYTFADSLHYSNKLKISGLDKYNLKLLMVAENKNDFLVKNLVSSVNTILNSDFDFTNKGIYWIDDKIDSFNKSIDNVEFVRIIRAGDKYAHLQTPDGVKEIFSLLDKLD